MKYQVRHLCPHVSTCKELIKGLKPVIGRPKNFTRHIHVEIDQEGEFGLKVILSITKSYNQGLPMEWENQLREAGFTGTDFKENKKELVQCLMLSTGYRNHRFESESRHIYPKEKDVYFHLIPS